MRFIVPVLVMLCATYTAYANPEDPLDTPSIHPFMESESFEQPILIAPEGEDSNLIEISIGRHSKSRKASAKKSEKAGIHRIHNAGDVSPSESVAKKPEPAAIDHPFAKEIMASLNKNLKDSMSLQVDQIKNISFESESPLLSEQWKKKS